jgi:hypothetical protein
MKKDSKIHITVERVRENNLIRFRLAALQFYKVCKLIDNSAKTESEFIEKYENVLRKQNPSFIKLDKNDYTIVNYMTAYGTNLALCIELSLKYILTYDCIFFDKIHNLDKLYSALTSSRKKEMQSRFNELIKENRTKQNIETTLAQISRCAIDYKYLESGSSYNPEFMLNFIAILDNLIQELDKDRN